MRKSEKSEDEFVCGFFSLLAPYLIHTFPLKKILNMGIRSEKKKNIQGLPRDSVSNLPPSLAYEIIRTTFYLCLSFCTCTETPILSLQLRLETPTATPPPKKKKKVRGGPTQVCSLPVVVIKRLEAKATAVGHNG